MKTTSKMALAVLLLCHCMMQEAIFAETVDISPRQRSADSGIKWRLSFALSKEQMEALYSEDNTVFISAGSLEKRSPFQTVASDDSPKIVEAKTFTYVLKKKGDQDARSANITVCGTRTEALREMLCDWMLSSSSPEDFAKDYEITTDGLGDLCVIRKPHPKDKGIQQTVKVLRGNAVIRATSDKG